MTRALGGAAALAVLGLAWPAAAQPDALPPRVRLMVPACADPLPGAGLSRAFAAELRTMGSDLASEGDAPLEVVVALPCGGDPGDEAAVTLLHVPSGRLRRDRVAIRAGEAGDSARVLALGLSELVRLHYAGLATDPPAPPEPPPRPPPAPPPVDLGALDARVDATVDAALEVRDAAEPPPALLVEIMLAAVAYPGASNASTELRAGLSFRAPAVRLGIELFGGGGFGAASLGDAATGELGLALALRYAHEARDWLLATGLRIAGGWTRAVGIPADPGVEGSTLDAPHLAAMVDARLRLRVGEATWLTLAPEIGLALVGIDARADGHRITAQVGPRLGLAIGAAFAPD